MSETGGSDELVSNTSSSRGKKRKDMKKFRSKVWKYFDRYIYEDGTKEAVGLLCNVIMSGNSSSGTSHLEKHIMRSGKKQNIREEEVPTYAFSQIESRKDLASMIILHEYPLSIVDHFGFRKYSAGLNPEFKFVSRNTTKKDIIRIFEIEKEKTLKLLEKVGRVAITTDMWLANTIKKGYMAVIAHFIDEKWDLQNRILTFAYVTVPHNSMTSSQELMRSFCQWNIERKISSITVDNVTTNDAMIDDLLDIIPRSDLLLDGKMFHMCCCADILNLIVKDGFIVIGSRIDRIRRSLFWTETQTRIENFESVAIQLNISTSKKLESDVKTHWNSTYYMLTAALIYKDVFLILKLRQKNYDWVPLEEDWVLADELCEKLKLFDVATQVFSGITYSTTNHYFPQICNIKLELLKWLGSPIEDIRNMASNMIEKYDKYWSDCHLVMGIACVSDPRYKMKVAEFYCRQIYGEESELEIEKIRKSCYDLFADYKSSLGISNDSMVGSSSDGVSLNEFLVNFDLYVNDSNIYSSCELDMYLRENLLPRKIEIDVLKWWDAQKGFPILQNMVKDLFSVQVSTVASKYSFSASGRLISPHRSRLHNFTIEASMCGRSWLWSNLKYSNLGVDPNYLATVIDQEDEPSDDIEV